MLKKVIMVLAIAAVAFAPQAKAFDFEVVAGYFLPEELDEDLTYGVSFGDRVNDNFGWLVRAMWFDVADSQGYGGKDIDADISHYDFSFNWYPTGSGFLVYGGPGWATGKIQDVPGTGNQEFSDDVFSFHVGVGYEAMVTERFYVKPDFRARWYELEGFGPDGGKQSQLNYEASVALGWRF
jgi:hypothetical protein